MQKYFIAILILVFYILGNTGAVFADIAETEPNDPCGTGISDNTITANDVYTGSIDISTDSEDYWYINTGSSGDMTIELTLASTPLQLTLVECLLDYCSEISTVITLSSQGESDTYTLNPNRNYHILVTLFGGGPGFGDYKFTISGEASLPVGLSFFSAHYSGEDIILEWVTESETDNLGFILERSVDSVSWKTIASYKTHDELKAQGHQTFRTQYTFTDHEVEVGENYYYRLSDVRTTGEITRHEPISIHMAQLPKTTVMENAYPNPFNPRTLVEYRLSEATPVKIEVYDMLGRFVKMLYNGEQTAGSYHVYWNGTNEQGTKAPTGNYMIRMETENGIQSQKVFFIK